MNTASQESAPGQEAVVEAVARVFRDPELGVRVEWLIEGGAGACLDQVLLASPTKLTNDEGYGAVYLAPPTVDAAVEAFRLKAVEVCDKTLPEHFDNSDFETGYIAANNAILDAIRALPGGTSALEEKCLKVAEEVRLKICQAQRTTGDYYLSMDEPVAIVATAINGEGK